MKTLSKFLIALLLLGGGFAGCDESEPTPLPYTEYSLNDSGNWNLDYGDPKVVRIDSDEQMRSYVTGDYPPVDFSTQTLVVAYGQEPYQNSPDETTFQKKSGTRFVMTVNLQQIILPAILNWQVAILVDKLSEESKVSLNITRL